jgi:hypothetical protein
MPIFCCHKVDRKRSTARLHTGAAGRGAFARACASECKFHGGGVEFFIIHGIAKGGGDTAA